MKKNLYAEAITAEKFSPYGDLMSLDDVEQIPCNQGRGIRFHDLAPNIELKDETGRAGVSVYTISASSLPFSVEVMERHPLGSQSFFPLAASTESRYLVIVAKSGEFDEDNMQAFIVKGSMGVSYGKGVWHLPIVALAESQQFLVIDRIGNEANCDEKTLKNDWNVIEKGL